MEETLKMWLIGSNLILIAWSGYWFLRFLNERKTLTLTRTQQAITVRERDLRQQLNDIYADDIATKAAQLHQYRTQIRELRLQLQVTLENEDFLNWQVSNLTDLNDRLTDRIQQAEEDYRHAKFHLATITKE